jgi:hypothetical protein
MCAFSVNLRRYKPGTQQPGGDFFPDDDEHKQFMVGEVVSYHLTVCSHRSRAHSPPPTPLPQRLLRHGHAVHWMVLAVAAGHVVFCAMSAHV